MSAANAAKDKDAAKSAAPAKTKKVKLFNQGERTIQYLGGEIAPKGVASLPEAEARKLKSLYASELKDLDDELKKFKNDDDLTDAEKEEAERLQAAAEAAKEQEKENERRIKIATDVRENADGTVTYTGVENDQPFEVTVPNDKK